MAQEIVDQDRATAADIEYRLDNAKAARQALIWQIKEARDKGWTDAVEALEQEKGVADQVVLQTAQEKTRVRAQNMAGCGRWRIRDEEVVMKGENRDDDAGTKGGGDVGGLQQCRNMLCPDCGKKVSAERARCLRAALKAWLEIQPGAIALEITLTAGHGLFTPLGDSKSGIMAAWQRMKNRTGWRKLSKGSHLWGWRVWEYTMLGPNGTHPHMHLLMVCSSRSVAESLCEGLPAQFVDAAQSLGIDCSLKGQKVKISEDPMGWASYVTKGVAEADAGPSESIRASWDAVSELTMSPLKTERGGGVSPALAFELVAEREAEGIVDQDARDALQELMVETWGLPWFTDFGKLPKEVRAAWSWCLLPRSS